MITVHLKPVNLDIRVAFGGMFSPEHRSKILADYARAKLAEAEAQNEEASGYVPDHDTWVDGVAEAPLENVKPDGVIVFKFHLLGQMFEWIAEMLDEHSPVKTGEYERGHVFYADGAEADPEDAPQADRYLFVNREPYSPKIERGESPQAPEGVYEGVAVMAAQRFSGLARISFGYVHEPTGDVRKARKLSGALPRVQKRRKPRIVGEDISQPAIIITVK